MELIVNRLAQRSKKYFLILIAVPILLGLVGWFLPVGKEASTYTAEATLSLGSYDYDSLNNAKNVMILLTNSPFYRENLPNLSKENLSKLQVTAVTDKIIKLSYTDSPKENATEVINQISTAFLKMDKISFQEKKEITQDSIQSLSQEKVSEDTIVDQQRFLNELKTTLFEIKPASLLESTDPSEVMTDNKALNSKERAVAGVLIGIALACAWVLIPELVRGTSE
ncbi:hypothetical protein IEC97_18400 [Neobacillus cucumis]|uniref:hypothetical protein n=1 Tax=Neobacillus cucumis TaxID=1740721 RepID=UPI0018E061DB|nr:hypothetical protein [Neobacillus cucumis]MBI0579347.1 hypothetical protein [Neobacillus cucumis]WHY92842.1 hypothetical protein QNK12_04850 [Neobacillus cucumis]